MLTKSSRYVGSKTSISYIVGLINSHSLTSFLLPHLLLALEQGSNNEVPVTESLLQNTTLYWKQCINIAGLTGSQQNFKIKSEFKSTLVECKMTFLLL